MGCIKVSPLDWWLSGQAAGSNQVVALDDPEFGRELAAQGGTLDRSLDTPAAIAREVHRRADLERDYLIRTGRLAR